MSRKLKARIIELYGGQWRFAAAIGEREAIVSGVVRGKIKLDPSKQEKWAAALDLEDPGTIFPKESSDGKAEA